MQLFKPDSASRLPIVPATPALVIPDFMRVFYIIDTLSEKEIANNKNRIAPFMNLIERIRYIYLY